MATEALEIGGKRQFALAALASLDGFWELDLRTNEAHFSPQWQRIAGLTGEHFTGTLEHWLPRVHPTDRERFEAELKAMRAGKSQQIQDRHRLRHNNGLWRWVTIRAVSARDESGAVTHIAGTMTDHTDRRMADPLTGLPNRLFFMDYLEHRFQRAQEHRDWNFAVLSLGLERFKLVNERLGYEGGDALLMEAAGRLTDAIGKWKISSETIVARLNAAEFLICLEGIEDETQATDAARHMTDELRRPFQWRGRKVIPETAIGVAKAEPGVASPEDLLHEADTALAEAKATGRGHLVCYSHGMRERALERMQLEADLEHAIRDGQLVLHYQPEIDLVTGRIVGFEALVRWQHPERGIVMPGEFIDLAEETGLILPLGDWGIREACRQVMAWRKLINETSPKNALDLRVSVNLSAKQFGRPGLVGRVAEILESTAMPASDLRLEVTESSLMSNPDTAQTTMQGLQRLGVGLHMDDFGTGYSSLNHLHRYPFDTLKIDRSFVQEISQKNSSEIVRTILDLARSLDMEVVAEGIETAEQAERLQSLGCHLGQGYYYARPMAADDVSALFMNIHQAPQSTTA